MRNLIPKNYLVLPTFFLLLALPGLDGVQARHADGEEAMEEVVVTGSRIRRNPLNEPAPIMNISEQDLDRTGRLQSGIL